MAVRNSCWILEERNGDYFCDCPKGSKGKLCKHTVGLLYSNGHLEATSDVRRVRLGQKRKPGRPKKLPICLARSPPPAPVPMEDDRLLEELPVDEHEPELMEVDPVEEVEELLNLSPPVIEERRAARRGRAVSAVQEVEELPNLLPPRRTTRTHWSRALKIGHWRFPQNNFMLQLLLDHSATEPEFITFLFGT